MAQLVTDKRNTYRSRALKGGVILLRHLGTTINCTVRNLSKTGACLIVMSQVNIPTEFELVLDRDNVPRRCRLAWRTSDRVGVEFQ
ncbi:MAG TPA: PilZ domain-containing protein [Bradyrhizobium sp.]|nr:PilZ domain-containing protein [Bradyrhizobium sp.]